MKIIKHIAKHDIHWITIQTRIVYDKKLSPLALKLLLHLLICTVAKYHPMVKDIAKQFGESERNMYRAIAQLKSAGYLVSTGYKEKCVWNVYECPKFLTDTGGSQDSITATECSQDNIQDCQNKTATGGRPLLSNNVVGAKSTPQQPIEEKQIQPVQKVQPVKLNYVDTSKIPNEMTQEEINKIDLPF